LAMSAQPVVAADAGLEVASQNTTESDFNSATLSNMIVEGTGSSADVTVPESTTSYNPVNSEGDGLAGDSAMFVGDTAADNGLNSEVEIQPPAGDLKSISVDIASTEGSDYGYVVDVYLIQEGVDGVAGEGTIIKQNWNPAHSTGSQSFALDNPVSVSGSTTYTLGFVTQSSNNDGAGDRLYISTDISGSQDAYSNNFFTGAVYASLSTEIAQPQSASYTGTPHDAEDVEELWANVSLVDSSATLRAQYKDGGSWQTAATQSVSSSGNYSFQTGGVSASQWRIDAEFQTDGVATATLHDEGALFQARDPNGSDPTPPTGTVTSSYDGDISINVSDPDFATAQGDEVTVTVSNQDGVAGSTTVTSNGTATISYTPLAGENNLTWTLTDSYGHSDTVSQSFTTPEKLSIYNASAPDQLITGTQNEIT
ncbi:MAG: C25 family peptidase C-terminal domain-containing protein, partial [Halobacteriaceae archaeon]